VTEEELKERKEIIHDFINEARDMLDNAEPQIIELEKKASGSSSIDQALINSIFRLFHSLKGTSSFLDLHTVTSVTHEAETLLDMFRKGKASVKPAHVDLMCKTNDFIRKIFDSLETTLTDADFEEDSEGIKKMLHDAIEAESGLAPAVPESTEIKNIAPANPAGVTVDITPDMIKMFVDQSIEAFEDAEKSILAIEKNPDDIESAVSAFRALHSLKGNAGFFGYTDIEQVAHAAEGVLDKIRNKEKKANTMIITSILRVLDVLRERVKNISRGITEEIGGRKEIIRILNALSDNVPGMFGILRSARAAKKAAVESKNVPAAVPVLTESLKAVPAEKAQAAVEEAKSAAKGYDEKQQAIRVDVGKIDILLDLVGELVISQAMVANNPDLNGMKLARFEKAIMQHDKIVRELQELSMAMRMIPLAGTFQKMVRLVRDLEHKLGKKVNLEITGEGTEVDKTIIEQIADPLVHLIRNAADHGIESPEDRVKAGKSAAGTIRLDAKHSAGEVLITVSDDGKGLYRDVLISKAIEKGILTKEQADAMTEQEVFKLIFRAGFSTADAVSNISGRGVGMDVVVRNIESLRGKVDIKSVPGEGTTFTVHIPLTLAIIDGMLIRVGKDIYIVPMNSIRDSFKADAGMITHLPHGGEIVRVRGELLPVLRLHNAYKLKPDFVKLTDGILMIVESEEKRCCLFVDDILGQQQIVIKGLSSYLGRINGISGCSILGDGNISLIIDVPDLLKSVAKTVAVA
jgi:two-component system chemotaxis sensor kinase CheA